MKGITCRTAKHIVFMASLLPLLLGGCTQDAKLAPGESPVVAAVAKELGGHRFLKVHSERNAQGYTIESGNLSEPLKGKPVGSLVVVTDKDGAITAIVDRPGRRGTLHVDKAGARRFLEEPPYDYLKPDTVEGPAEPASASAANKPDSTAEIDALVLFSSKALEVLNADPVAFALAQLETSYLALRNSQVEGVHLRLAGVRVTDTDYAVDEAGLRAARQLLSPLRSEYRQDINVGYFAQAHFAGLAFVAGTTNINAIQYPTAFRHEVAHNVGGGHCYPDVGDNYKHGFKVTEGQNTIQCGDQLPFYSNPDVFFIGAAFGDAQTANMARLWREQGWRMSGYTPAFNGERMIYLSTGNEARLLIRNSSHRSEVGVVALSPEVGPTSMVYDSASVTTLTVKMTNSAGQKYPVNIRAYRQASTCPVTSMNSYQVCHPDEHGATTLAINFYAVDNPELPPGWYSGTVELKALNYRDPEWSLPVLVSLAVRR